MAGERALRLRERRRAPLPPAALDPGGRAADDERQQAAGPPSWPRSKTNCAGGSASACSSSIGSGRRHAGAARVDGDDRLVAQRRRLRRPGRHRCGATRRAASTALRGDDDAVEGLVVEPPARAVARRCARPDRAEPHRRARASQPGERRLGQQGAERPPRQQQVGSARAGAERVACSTRRNTAPLASAAGVFSAATQSGSMNSARTRAGSVAVRSATVAVGSQRKSARPARAPCASSAKRSRQRPAAPPITAARTPAAAARPAGAGPCRRIDEASAARAGRHRLRRHADVCSSAASRRRRRCRCAGRCRAHGRAIRPRAPARRVRRHLEQRHAAPAPARIDRRREAGPAAADDGDLRAGAATSAAAPVRAHRDPELAHRRQRNALVQHLEAVGLDLAQQACGRCWPSSGPASAPRGRLRQQRERFVVAPVRALGLECHQGGEAFAVAAVRAARAP